MPGEEVAMPSLLRTWPKRFQTHLHDRHILARLLIAGHTFGFGLVFLLRGDLIHSQTSKSYGGMAWMPQAVWGWLAVLTGLTLVLSATDTGRRIAYLLALFWISVVVSLILGSGTILTGTTTYGWTAIIVYKLLAARSINEPGEQHGP
ncbi:hypothetical protein SAMN00790413_01031 [Deinococcus hopiensis KR-140]|uniref:Uncharacterized protein n=2 Tax=Deinococcus TaxID=1298 RepID=A0A1W1VCU1_9DEIO|nr:hypothetical protein SAMN00790413_01031 [Deinococcus hopiensis KR-140]